MDRLAELLDLAETRDLTDEETEELRALEAEHRSEGNEDEPEAVLTEAQARRLQDLMERMGQQMAERQETIADNAISAMETVVSRLEGQRSRRAPVDAPRRARTTAPPRGSREGYGDAQATYTYSRIEVRDGTYDLYRELHEREPELKYRDPRIDDLGKQWLIAFAKNHHEKVEKIGRELNDRYVENRGSFLGTSGQRDRAALLEGSPDASSGFADGSGGELLPLPLANQIVLARNKASKLRGLVARINMTSQTSRQPVAPTVAAAQVAEGSTASDATPNPTSVLLSAKKTQVRFSASREMLDDSGYNLSLIHI